MRKFITAMLVAGAALVAGPASAQYPGATVSPGTVGPGGTVTVTGQGCSAGEEVVITLRPAADEAPETTGAAAHSSGESTRTVLRAQGFSCPSCVAKIEKALEHLPGVEDATVHFTTGRIVVQHDPGIVPAADLVKTVGDVGYTAKVTAF